MWKSADYHGVRLQLRAAAGGLTQAPSYFFSPNVWFVRGPSQLASWSILRALLTLHTKPGSRYRCGKSD